MKYFTNTNTQEQLKKKYKEWAFQLHPDCGGNEEEFKEMQDEYRKVFEIVKNKQINFKGETYEKETQETPQEFINIINKLIKMGLSVELIGVWVWITGDTKPYKEELKEMGCRWAPKKSCWSWHFEEGKHKHYRGDKSLDELRTKYGSKTFGNTQVAII